MGLFRYTLPLIMTVAVAGAARAQQAEPGTGSTQVTPASASPQTSAEPNLRTDSKPHVDATPATDSGPKPETVGVGEPVPMDMGLDYSLLPDSSEQHGYTTIYSSKGVKQIELAPPRVRPVTNPPDPPSRVLAAPPFPPVRHMPTPPSPAPPPRAVVPPR